MKTNEKTLGRIDRKVLLSSLWIFATLNYLYCDIVGFMDPVLLNQYVTGVVNGMHLNASFLLAGAILMEIPISMMILSRLLKYTPNRVVNIIAGSIMTLVQTASLLAGAGPTIYYSFFSAIEIASTILVVLLAILWRKE